MISTALPTELLDPAKARRRVVMLDPISKPPALAHAPSFTDREAWKSHAAVSVATLMAECRVIEGAGPSVTFELIGGTGVAFQRTSAAKVKEHIVIEGSCLCGAVKLRIQEPLEHVPEACHCAQCRKHTGTYWTGVNVRRTSLEVQGAESVRWFQSSDKVRRGSCMVCGSTLFWDPTIDGYKWTAVAMGCIDTPLKLKISKHIFVADKGGYYDINDGAPQYQSS